jgi:hypothetical protein
MWQFAVQVSDEVRAEMADCGGQAGEEDDPGAADAWRLTREMALPAAVCPDARTAAREAFALGVSHIGTAEGLLPLRLVHRRKPTRTPLLGRARLSLQSDSHQHEAARARRSWHVATADGLLLGAGRRSTHHAGRRLHAGDGTVAYCDEQRFLETAVSTRVESALTAQMVTFALSRTFGLF